MVEEKKRERLLELLRLKLVRKYYKSTLNSPSVERKLIVYSGWRSVSSREQYYRLALKQFRVATSSVRGTPAAPYS